MSQLVRKPLKHSLESFRYRKAAPAAKSAVKSRAERYRNGVKQLSAPPGRPEWPPRYADPFPELSGVIPEIQASELGADTVFGAVEHHGIIIVRGLLEQAQVDDLRNMQDRVKAASQTDELDLDGWYVPFDTGNPMDIGLRKKVEGNGGNFLADSPLGLDSALHHLEVSGVSGLMSEYFRERPAISLQKATLRSVKPEPGMAGWHQDGAFLGEKVRTMNIWVALSPCGGSTGASGVEIIPTRLDEIFRTEPGLGRAPAALEITQGLIDQHSTVTPEFAPGDAMIFDEKLLHRTALSEELSSTRYALECWFFAPSHAAPTYTPFLI